MERILTQVCPNHVAMIVHIRNRECTNIIGDLNDIGSIVQQDLDCHPVTCVP